MTNKECELQSGLKFNIQVPESVTEFDALPGGRVGLCLECAIDDVLYRGPFADVRDALAKALAVANPSIPRKTKPHPNAERAAKGDVVNDESEGKYIARVAAELAVEETTFQPVLDTVMATNEALPVGDKAKFSFSVEKVARTGGGLVGKTDLADAAELIGQGPEKLAISLGRLASAMGIEPIGLDADPATAVRQLGMKLKERRAQLAKQTKADLMG